MTTATMTARTLAILSAAALLAGCASVGTSPAGTAAPGAPPRARPSAQPSAAPVDPAATIARLVPPDRPRLLPGAVPAGMTARATVNAYGYEVVYADDLHTKWISLTDVFGQNPPPHGNSGASATRQFRGARSSYVVYDATAPTSQRYLIWDEPGGWPRDANGMPVNEFFLNASGLTEAEFFQVADSLRPVS